MARILIVDDDPLVRELLGIQLSRAGHNVTEADEASTAIRQLLRRDFDAVLTDVDMPYLDGVELASAIRGDPKTRHIPVIVLTGRTDDATWQRARFAGVHQFLTKPVHGDELLRAIEKAAMRAAIPLQRRASAVEAVPGETARAAERQA